MRVALYARVSTSDNSQNPESQLFKLRERVKNRDWIIIGEYVDTKSGKDANRPELQRLLEDCRAGKIDIIFITKLDRMMRSVKNLLNVLEDLNRWNVNLECIDQPIETHSAMGKMMVTILGAVAEFESELISERVRDGMTRAKLEGKHVGRPKKRMGQKSTPPFSEASQKSEVEENER